MADSEQRSNTPTKPNSFILPMPNNIGTLPRVSGLGLGLMNSMSLSSGRLESFRAPRDLSLSNPPTSSIPSKQKRKFEPVIPSKIKPKNTSSASSPSDAKKVKKEFHVKKERHDRGRGRGRGGRGRGNNTIQTMGVVFGEGIAYEPIHRFRDRSDSSRSAAKKIDIGPKPFFKKEEPDPEDDEEIINSMKRTGFIDDGYDEDVKIIGSVPMSVPFRRLVKTIKTENIKLEIKKEEPKSIVINGVSIKTEVKDEADFEIDESNEIKPDLSSLPPPPETVEEIVNQSMFLLQLPDSLPGHVEAEYESKPGSSQETPSKSRHSESVPCTLQNLEPGLLGHLEILASGRARINLGSNRVLYLDVGTASASRQELVAVDTDEERQEGSIKALGEVISCLICTPDWYSELNQIKAKKS